MMRITGIVAGFAACVTIVLWLAAQAFGAAQERQVTYRLIGDALAEVAEFGSRVAWLDPAAPLVRQFTPADADRIGLALTDAWRAYAVAQETGETAVLTDHMTGVAHERAVRGVADALTHGGRMVVLSITATPVFYHKDGSLFQAELDMVVARYLIEDGELRFHETVRDRGVATLLNESNGWRLFSYERRGGSALAAPTAQWMGTANGLNYYPAETPWREFWSGFDPEVIDGDFERIRDLGADTVRVFLTRSAFLVEEGVETAIADLRRLLDLAERHDLQVVPTLFDLKPDYLMSGWADDALILERVLPVLAASEVVAFLDLKNEPDLDFAAHGAAHVTVWLGAMIDVARDLAPHVPLTIGWSVADAAPRLADRLDVISYHDYAPIAGAAERLAEVRERLPGRPVVVTEIGISSYTFALGFPSSEESQAEDLARRLEALEAADGVLVWTLHDFAQVDPTVVGASPWVRRLQSSFGVIGTDGREKPAASVIRRWLAGQG